MPKSTPWSSLTIALGLCLLLPLSVAAQSEADAGSTPPPAGESASLPELEGLAWYRSIDLSGSEMQSALSEDEVAEWGTMLDGAGATFDQLEYTYQAAFDPSTLPELGGLATVRIVGADTDVLREVVVEDIVSQVVGRGNDVPELEQSTVGEKDVTIVRLPPEIGLEDAIVYASGDVAYIFLMSEDLAALGLAQLP